MPSPRTKRTSRATFQRIVEALDEMQNDDEAPRTKREIERRTGLAHDAVARAFRQDAQEDNEFEINKKFAGLAGQLTVPRVSPDRDKQIALQRENVELKDRIRHLDNQLDRHAMALFACHLRDAHPTRSSVDVATEVIPIRRRRYEN